MRSLPKIMKGLENDELIQPYDFFADFQIQRNEEKHGSAEEAGEPEEALSGEELVQDAREKAEMILEDAHRQAELLLEQAYEEAKQTGWDDGYREAREEHKKLMDQEMRDFQRKTADILQSVSREKEKILEHYIDDLKRVSIAVAEKIIQTSIQSSGDIIKRMILAATDKMVKKQWAKIYITKAETGISLDVDTEFLEALSHLSDNIKIVTMDNGEEGTCIIELPDEIIDASVGTQLENIKDIINNVRA